MELYSPDSGEIAVMLKGNKETLTSSWRHLYAYVPQGKSSDEWKYS